MKVKFTRADYDVLSLPVDAKLLTKRKGHGVAVHDKNFVVIGGVDENGFVSSVEV